MRTPIGQRGNRAIGLVMCQAFAPNQLLLPPSNLFSEHGRGFAIEAMPLSPRGMILCKGDAVFPTKQAKVNPLDRRFRSTHL
ncbi:MAG: hypothetical protein R3F11_08045 [Verrucomicrobiales bacterium]